MKIKNLKENKPFLGIILGLFAAVLLTVVSAMVLAMLVINGSIPETSVHISSQGMQLVSCTVGFVLTGKLSKEKLAIRIGICAVTYLVSLVGIGTLIPDRDFTINWGIVIVTLISFMIACTICIRRGRAKRRKKNGSW